MNTENKECEKCDGKGYPYQDDNIDCDECYGTGKEQMKISDDVYNTIDYKDAFNHIRALADLEWNGKVTITHFRDRVNDIISVISEKESE